MGEGEDASARTSRPSAVSNRTMPPCTVIPVLVYDDVIEAIDWLCDRLGFVERWRVADHRAQLSFAGCTVAITEPRTSNVRPCPQAVLVRVPDARAHHDHARARDAKIVAPPSDFRYGERQYTVEDLGGHRWTFSESIADLAPEEWGGVSGPALASDVRAPLTEAPHPPADGAHISVMLIVPDAPAALAWYRDALGATTLWDLGGVAGLSVGGSPFFLHEVNPRNPAETDPGHVGVTSTRIEVFVDDPDSFIARAVSAGATLRSPVQEHRLPWGAHRQGGFHDPFGHSWSVGDRSPLRASSRTAL